MSHYIKLTLCLRDQPCWVNMDVIRSFRQHPQNRVGSLLDNIAPLVEISVKESPDQILALLEKR